MPAAGKGRGGPPAVGAAAAPSSGGARPGGGRPGRDGQGGPRGGGQGGGRLALAGRGGFQHGQGGLRRPGVAILGGGGDVEELCTCMSERESEVGKWYKKKKKKKRVSRPALSAPAYALAPSPASPLSLTTHLQPLIARRVRQARHQGRLLPGRQEVPVNEGVESADRGRVGR